MQGLPTFILVMNVVRVPWPRGPYILSVCGVDVAGAREQGSLWPLMCLVEAAILSQPVPLNHGWPQHPSQAAAAAAT